MVWTGTITPQVQVSEGWMRVGEYHCGEALQLLDQHYKEPPHGHNQVFAHLLQKESQVSSGEQVMSHCGEA